MARTWLKILLVITVLELAGCGSGSEPEEPAAQIPPAPQAPVVEEPESAPELEQRVAVSGLIPPTNAEQRVETIVKGRQDPFRVITVSPRIAVPPSTEEIPPPPEPTNLEPPDSGENPLSSEENPLSNEPDTRLAEEVIINGILEVGDTVRIILKAPQEDFSRYVEVGQYVAEGKVLVKGVEVTDRNIPLVILEQSGVEIRKPIGEPTET